MEYLEERFREDGSADEKLSDIVELVDYSSISVSGDTVRFLKKGMKIVLNSIAKGYAVDLASDIFKEIQY
jgi:thiamine biosynthesis lipoprotein ApbE